MRIRCETIDDFLENLKHYNVFEDVVHYNRTRRRMGPEKHNYSYEVGYQVSALIEFEEGGQALLECGVECGIDRETSDGTNEGTMMMMAHHTKVSEFCEKQRYRMLPGIIDM